MKTTKSILLIGLGRFGRHLALKFHLKRLRHLEILLRLLLEDMN